MAQSLKCTHCGAVLKPKNPIAAGKKVKCPKCEKAFVVEDEEEPEEEETADEEEQAEDEEESSKDEDEGDDDKGGDEDDESDDEEDEKPKKKGKQDAKAKKKKSKGDDDDDDDDEKPKKSKTGLLLGIIGGVLFLCCVGCGGVYFVFDQAIKKAIGLGQAIEKDLKEFDKKLKIDPKVDQKVDQKADGKIDTKPLVLKADFKVTAVDFAQEFRENEKAANKKYLGKVIEITGELLTSDDSIARFGADGKLGVVLDGLAGNRLNVPVQPSDHARAYRVSRQQKLKVVAPFQSQFGAILIFNTGSVAEVDKSKAIEVTSENLVKEYLKDDFAADGKYRDKTVLITGQVIDVQPGSAKLKGDGGKDLLVGSLGQFEHPRLQKGTQALIRADRVRFDAAKKEVTVSSAVVADK